MSYTKTGTRCVFMAAVLAVIFACIMIMSCGTVYAGDQEPEAQPLQTEAAAPAEQAETPEEVSDQTPAAETPEQASAQAPAAETPEAASEETPEAETLPPVAEDAQDADIPASAAEQASQEAAQPDASEEAAPAEETAQPAAEDNKADTAAVPASGAKAASQKAAQPAAKAAAGPVRGDTGEADEDAYDITAQTVTGLRYDESSGVLSWDPVEAPSGTTIKYYIYMMADNIKSATYKRLSGVKGLIMATAETSVNIDRTADFRDLFIDYEGADYTFYVRATDDSKDSNGRRRFSGEAASAVHSMSHYQLEVQVYTRVYTYNKKKNTFGPDIRRVSYYQGGQIRMNGEDLTRVRDSNGEWFNVHTVIRAIRSGTTVELSYEPESGYIFYSEKLDDGANDQNAATTRTLTMDRPHKVVVYFKQPFAEIVASGIEVTSDNLEDIAGIKLSDDAAAAGKASGIEGHMQMRVSTVSAASLSAADRNICENDAALRAGSITSGVFFEISFYDSLDRSALSQFGKLPNSVNIVLTIPDSLKTTDTSIRRTYYLIRVYNGEATIIASGTLEELSGYITESGLYMIGYKDTDLSGILSGSTGGSGTGFVFTDADAAAAGTEAAPETGFMLRAPEITSPAMITPPEQRETGAGFPGSLAAAGVAAAAGGAYGIRRLLRVLAAARIRL